MILKPLFVPASHQRTDSGFFMGERKVSNFQKIILSIAIATMFVSYCLGANVLIQSVHGFFLVISVLIIAAAIKSGEGIFAHLATGYFLDKKYFLSAFFAGLCALLLAVSVSGTTMFLLIQHKKDTAKLEAAKEFLMTKEKDVEFARQELHGCKSTHVTKCVLPKTAILNEKIAERDEAAKKFAKYTDAKGIDTAWHDFAEFVGVSSGDDENSVNTEIFRNLALATLADVIAMILIAVVHLEFFKSEPKDEVKKTTSSRRDDDFIEPDFNDYKQPERTFNREPVKAPVNYQPVTDWQSFSFEEEKKDVVKFIMDLPAGRSVAILGQSGFGKSSLLGHLGIEALNRGHQVFAIDPHFNITESSFDPRCQIIGKSANGMAEIKNFIFWLKKELDKREMELKTIPYVFDSWPTYVVLMDEMFEVINAAGLTKEFAVMYTKMRKYKIVFLGISQSFNVKSMGVEGNQDLLKTFEIFQLSGASDDYKITHAVLDDNGKKRIVKGIFDHPGQIKFSHIPDGQEQPDFKQTLKKIVTPNAQNLKKLNDDIFPV